MLRSLILKHAPWSPSGQSPEARCPIPRVWMQPIIACLSQPDDSPHWQY